jgi:hypothetical protein
MITTAGSPHGRRFARRRSQILDAVFGEGGYDMRRATASSDPVGVQAMSVPTANI